MTVLSITISQKLIRWLLILDKNAEWMALTQLTQSVFSAHLHQVSLSMFPYQIVIMEIDFTFQQASQIAI